VYTFYGDGIMGNPIVRIWDEVYTPYKVVAKKYDLKISDLMSIVLLYTPLFSPAAIMVALQDNYEDISRDEIYDIVSDLKESLEKVIELAFSEEKEVTEEKIVSEEV